MSDKAATKGGKKEDAADELKIEDKYLKAAHAVMKEVEAELKGAKNASAEDVVDGRRVLSGQFFVSVNSLLQKTLEKIAAAAHVVFTKENIPTLIAIVKAFPGESTFETMLLLVLEQWQRTLPNDPNADLTVEALNR